MNKEYIDKQIKILRQEMYDTVNKYGLSDPRSVEVSQRLDKLLNKINNQK